MTPERVHAKPAVSFADQSLGEIGARYGDGAVQRAPRAISPSFRDQSLGEIAARYGAGTESDAAGAGAVSFRGQSLGEIAAAFPDRDGSQTASEGVAGSGGPRPHAEGVQPLLDEVAGGSSADTTGTIRARAPNDAKAREDHTRNEVVRTSLLAAQYWFDAAIDHARLRENKLDAVTARTTFLNAERNLVEAWNTAEHVARFDRAVIAQMDETTNAYLELLELALLADDPDANRESELNQLAAANTALRSLMKLREAPKHASHHKAHRSKNHYEGMAIGPVLELIAIEGGKLFAHLVEHSDQREAIVADPGSTLGAHLAQAIFLLRSHDDKHEAETFRRQVQAASAPLLKIHAWIQMRENNAELVSTFRSTIARADQLRALVELGPVTSMDAPRMPQSEVEEAAKETGALAAAQRALGIKMATAFKGVDLGAARFKELSKLKRPPPPPEEASFFDELTKGILISVIGNIAGPVMGVFAKKLGNLGDRSEKFLQAVEGTTVDSIEAIAGEIADGAFNVAGKPKSGNDDLRARQLFYESVVRTKLELDAAVQLSISNRIQEKRISAAEIGAMVKTLDLAASQTDIANVAYLETAHGYAQDVLRKSVGKQTNADGQVVSDLDAYLGKEVRVRNPHPSKLQPGATIAKTVGVKAGSTGIAKLSIEVFDHGSAGIVIKKFELHGMNDDMALAIMERADYRIDKIDLPMEIHLTSSWPGSLRGPGKGGAPASTALIVVDEAGAIRHSAGWPAFGDGPSSDGWGREHERARNADFYSTPENLWNAIRHDPVPKDAAKITPGG